MAWLAERALATRDPPDLIEPKARRDSRGSVSSWRVETPPPPGKATLEFTLAET